MTTRATSARRKIVRILPATTCKVKGFQAIATRWGLALALAEIDWLGKNAECQKTPGVQKAVMGAGLPVSSGAPGRSAISSGAHDCPRAEIHTVARAG